MSKQKIEKRFKKLEANLAAAAAYKGSAVAAAAWDDASHEAKKQVKAATKTAARVSREVEAQNANIKKFRQEILVEIAETKKRLDQARLAHASSYM